MVHVISISHCSRKSNQNNDKVVTESSNYSESTQFKTVNQNFADMVFKAFYVQGKEYEEKIKPLMQNFPTNNEKEKLFRIWGKSVEDLIIRLNRIQFEGVDSTLVKTLYEVIITAQSVVDYINKIDITRENMELFMLFERLGSQQLELEIEARKRGLEIYAYGVD